MMATQDGAGVPSIRKFIKNLYRRYEIESKKREKIEAVEAIAKEIAKELNTNYRIMWRARERIAEVYVMIPSKLEDKIKEIWEYIYPEYVVYNTYVLVTSKKVEEYKKVRNDIREIVREIKYKEENGTYRKYIFVGAVSNVHVYIVVVDGKGNEMSLEADAYEEMYWEDDE